MPGIEGFLLTRVSVGLNKTNMVPIRELAAKVAQGVSTGASANQSKMDFSLL